ncbi:hypothetical protein VNO77_43568 [Canavalia gladiata]|uniref:Uncharacterized protein n=1 Tax=Canavalia gladiata TaxID=3824 RepID=A0AAN9PN12_CANGL
MLHLWNKYVHLVLVQGDDGVGSESGDDKASHGVLEFKGVTGETDNVVADFKGAGGEKAIGLEDDVVSDFDCQG